MTRILLADFSLLYACCCSINYFSQTAAIKQKLNPLLSEAEEKKNRNNIFNIAIKKILRKNN